MPIRAALFDLDGTLLDTLADLADATNAVLRHEGLPPHPRDAYRYFVGDGAQNLMLRAVPAEKRSDAALVARCAAAWRDEYRRNWNAQTRPYPGIPEMLAALAARGLKLAVLSNKPDDFTKLMVASLLPACAFEAVLGQRPGVPLKPDPAAAREIAAVLKIPPREFVYLGDTATDMNTARAAGMLPAGALWGFRTAEELTGAGAQVLLKEPKDLLSVLDAATGTAIQTL